MTSEEIQVKIKEIEALGGKKAIREDLHGGTGEEGRTIH
jgi:hypothetical protein